MKRLFSILILFFTLSISRNLTLDEFVELDKTNEIMFVEDVFDCQQYTETFVKNATVAGFVAHPVYAGLYKNGEVVHHMFVEVVIDGEVFWIEPQLDLYYKISEVGKPLCLLDGRCVTKKTIYIYIEPNQTTD